MIEMAVKGAILMGAVALVMGRSREEAEGRLREQLVKDLGIGGTPELAWALRANVSREEYVKMYKVWREGEEQAEMAEWSLDYLSAVQLFNKYHAKFYRSHPDWFQVTSCTQSPCCL